MKRTKTFLEKKTITCDLNNMWARPFFTTEEQDAFDKERKLHPGGMLSSYIEDVEFWTYTVHLEIDRAYLEEKLGLRQVLQIMHKLSNRSHRGALSKQLYAYYEKVGVSTLGRDLKKVYKKVNYMEFSEDGRKNISTNCVINLGKKEYNGLSSGVQAMERIAQEHLTRCIAILRKKGYIEIQNKKYTRSYRRGGQYNYSNTYYKLTEKAEKLLGVVQQQ